MNKNEQSIEELYQMIKERKSDPVKGSYTDYLFNMGLDKILKKVGEESTEVIVAAKNSSDDDFIYEFGDMVYHVLVLMADCGINPEQIKQELAKREGLMSKTKERDQIKKL